MPPTFTSRDAENLWKCCFANIDAQSDTIKHWEKNCISYKQSIRTKQYKVKRSLFRYSQFQVYGFSLPSQAATSREISCATLYIHIAVLKAVSERSSARYSWSRFDVSMASTKLIVIWWVQAVCLPNTAKSGNFAHLSTGLLSTGQWPQPMYWAMMQFFLVPENAPIYRTGHPASESFPLNLQAIVNTCPLLLNDMPICQQVYCRQVSSRWAGTGWRRPRSMRASLGVQKDGGWNMVVPSLSDMLSPL